MRHRLFIDGGWVDPAGGRAFRHHRSGDRGAHRRDRPRRGGGCRSRRQGGRCRHEGALVAAGAGGARGAAVQAGRYHRRPSRGAGPARDPGCRQAAQGFPGRCRWRGDDAALQRRGGRQDAGRDHPARPRCGGFHPAGAAGRHRPYRALEFSLGHGDPLPGAGAGRRLHRGAETGGAILRSAPSNWPSSCPKRAFPRASSMW